MDIACGICHEDNVTEIGELDSCDHRFCHSCIFKWSQIENKCPFCKVRFTYITKKLLSSPLRCATAMKQGPLPGVVVSREKVVERNQRAVFEDPGFLEWLEAVVCMICHGAEDEDQLLLCDGCDRACHTYCLGLSEIPDSDWYCSQCQDARRGINERQDPIIREDRRRRSHVILDSDDDDYEQEEEQSLTGTSESFEVEEIEQVLEPPRRRLRLLRSEIHHQRNQRSSNARFEETSAQFRTHSNPRARERMRARDRIDAFQRNWDALRTRRVEYGDLISESQEDEDNSVEIIASHERQQSQETIDLTRSVAQVQEQEQWCGSYQLTPPMIRLKTKLQHDLQMNSCNGDQNHAGPSTYCTGQERPSISSMHTIKSTTGTLRTVGDLNFGAHVALNGSTPSPSKGNHRSSLTPINLLSSSGSGHLFADRTRELVGRFRKQVNTDGSSSPKPLRERLEYRYGSSLASMPPEATELSTPKHNGTGPRYKKAQELLRAQIKLLFSPGDLSQDDENEIQRLALQYCQSNLAAEAEITLEDAGVAIDQAMVAWSRKSRNH